MVGVVSIASQKVRFAGSQGELDARLELPEGEPLAFALFAHCFTCSKESVAAARISRALADEGFAVLRFDFTGLGDSSGDFANTDFSSNVEDLVLAADYLRKQHRAPALLVGHSLGGAAVLVARARIPEVKAVVTLNAPCDPAHATQVVGSLGAALLVMHAPTDTIVGVDNARRIFEAARHPKSFISLDTADHLLSNRADASFAARVISAWAARYVIVADPPASQSNDQHAVVVAETHEGRFTQSVVFGTHRLRADEPVAMGGLGSGPSPYDLLLAALGACTSMTLRMYAEHKKLPLDGVRVTLTNEKIYAKDCSECVTKVGQIDHIDRVVEVEGELTDEQRTRLLEIADKCPVHRTLNSEVKITSRLAD